MNLFDNKNLIEGARRGRMASNDIVLRCTKPYTLLIPASVVKKYKIDQTHCVFYLDTADKEFIYLGIEFGNNLTSLERRRATVNPLSKVISISAASLVIALEKQLHLKPTTRVTFSIDENESSDNRLVCKVSKALL